MKENEKEERKTEEFVDSADIVRHTVKIHTKTSTMSEDYVLTRWTDKPKEAKFVRKAHQISDRIMDFIKDKEVATLSSRAVRRDANNLAIMGRNDNNNWLLRKVFGRTQLDDLDKEDIETKDGIVENTKGFLFGKKEKRQINFE